MDNNGMEVKNSYYYTDKHEWVKADGNTALCGITDYAQHSLGDIVFAEIAESIRDSSSGSIIEKGDVIAVVESAKAASDVYTPVSGQVIEVNTVIEDTPETLNNSPYDKGWMIKLELSNPSEIKELMTPDQYRKLISSGE